MQECNFSPGQVVEDHYAAVATGSFESFMPISTDIACPTQEISELFLRRDRLRSYIRGRSHLSQYRHDLLSGVRFSTHNGVLYDSGLGTSPNPNLASEILHVAESYILEVDTDYRQRAGEDQSLDLPFCIAFIAGRYGYSAKKRWLEQVGHLDSDAENPTVSYKCIAEGEQGSHYYKGVYNINAAPRSPDSMVPDHDPATDKNYITTAVGETVIDTSLSLHSGPGYHEPVPGHFRIASALEYYPKQREEMAQ